MTTNIVNVFEPAQFGIGDGATTQFQIGGPREVVTSITPTGVWRQDWQGNQLLYPTPRTNFARWSEDFSNGAWARLNLGSVTPSQPGSPNGGSTVTRLVESTATGQRRIAETVQLAGASSTTFTAGVFVRPDPNRTGIVIYPNSGGSGCIVRFNLTDGNIVLVSNVGAGTGSAAIRALANGWYFLSVTVNYPAMVAASNFWIYFSNDPNLGNASYAGDGVSGIDLWGASFVEGGHPGSYIPTVALPATLTDYSVSSTGLITLGQVPAIGAALTWTGSYTYEYREDAPTLADRTVISQYANSPTLRQLVQNMDEYINPDTDFDAFYSYVWNVETAQGFGLDIWGRIIGVSRMLTIPGAGAYLGYKEAYTAPTAATGAQPFGQAPMYVGTASTQTYRLADDAYRKLILVKALANISDCTSPSLNRLLSNLFAGRGRCYVSDTGQMEFRYVFEFALEPYEIAILTQSGAIPKPAAVLANVLQVDLPTTFGFNEALMQPFGSGVFFTSSGLIHASQ